MIFNKVPKFPSNLTWQPERLRSKTCQKIASKVTRRHPRERKKATPAASAAILTLFSQNCAYLRQDFSTFVAETRESRCLPEDPCGILR